MKKKGFFFKCVYILSTYIIIINFQENEKEREIPHMKSPQKQMTLQEQ